MAEQTIEFEETVTKEETVTICDECGREQDEDGISYEPNITLSRAEDTGMPRQLHYCSECVAEMDDSWTPEYVERADDWLQEKDSSGWTVEDNIRAARTISLFGLVFTGAIFVIISTVSFPVFLLLCTVELVQILTIMFTTDALGAE